MKYPTSSAIENHFLQSILPHSFFEEERQFTKTKDFYQPEKFIWNNPHRTSAKIYPYYHKFNEDYLRNIQPKIKELEQHDRNEKEENRIKHLLDLKAQTRQAFFNRQKQRKTLQDRCFSKSNAYKINTQSSIPFSVNYNHPHYNQHSLANSKRTLQVQKSYLDGIAKSDLKNNRIQKLITHQRQMTHNNIRQKFQKRKLQNFQTMNKIVAKSSNRKSAINYIKDA